MKLHVQPTVVLLSTRVDESVDAYLDPGGRSRGSVTGEGICRRFMEISVAYLDPQPTKFEYLTYWKFVLPQSSAMKPGRTNLSTFACAPMMNRKCLSSLLGIAMITTTIMM